MTNSFAHLGEAKMLLLIGSNITEAHPVAGTLVKRAVRNGCRLIVVDPRRTGIAKEAETHLQLRVGSDIALLNAIMHVLIRDDLYDKHFVARHTLGFEELRRSGPRPFAASRQKSLSAPPATWRRSNLPCWPIPLA